MLPHGSSLLLFLSATIVLLVVPGPAVLYVTGRTIGQGRTAGLVSVLGIGAGTLCHVVAAALGISALLASSAMAFGLIKYIGAAYLIFLGVQRIITREAENGLGAAAPSPARLSRVFGQGIIVNVLNPKTALFFLAFLPQFVSPERGSVALQIMFLGTMFAVMGVMSDSMWVVLAAAVSRWLQQSRRWFDVQRYISGGLLIGLGVVTAFSGTHKGK